MELEGISSGLEKEYKISENLGLFFSQINSKGRLALYPRGTFSLFCILYKYTIFV